MMRGEICVPVGFRCDHEDQTPRWNQSSEPLSVCADIFGQPQANEPWVSENVDFIGVDLPEGMLFVCGG